MKYSTSYNRNLIVVNGVVLKSRYPQLTPGDKVIKA